VQEGTGTTVHDVRAGGSRAARSGTVEPVPGALDCGGFLRVINLRRINTVLCIMRMSMGEPIGTLIH